MSHRMLLHGFPGSCRIPCPSKQTPNCRGRGFGFTVHRPRGKLLFSASLPSQVQFGLGCSASRQAGVVRPGGRKPSTTKWCVSNNRLSEKERPSHEPLDSPFPNSNPEILLQLAAGGSSEHKHLPSARLVYVHMQDDVEFRSSRRHNMPRLDFKNHGTVGQCFLAELADVLTCEKRAGWQMSIENADALNSPAWQSHAGNSQRPFSYNTSCTYRCTY